MTRVLQVLLVIIFFFAKIYGLIDWTWWWVFAPIWLPWLGLSILLILAISIRVL